MQRVFPQSRELKQLIEKQGWTLYLCSQRGEQPCSWEQMEAMQSAKEYTIGNNYIFAPIPQNNQTLRKAYSITKGIGPSLRIDNSKDERWRALNISKWSNIAIFSRLFFEEEFLVASTPEKPFEEVDIVMIKYDFVLDTFMRCFSIISPNDYQQILARAEVLKISTQSN